MIPPQGGSRVYQFVMEFASDKLFSGAVDNEDGETAKSGTVVPSDLVPVPWWVALALILLGFTGLLLARPTMRPGKG